jgi:hypothetical protein
VRARQRVDIESALAVGDFSVKSLRILAKGRGNKDETRECTFHHESVHSDFLKATR